MKYAPLLASLFAYFLPSFACADNYQADLTHSSVYFGVSHFERSQVRGRFNKIAIKELQFSAGQASGKLVVEIDPESIDTGVRLLDVILKGEQYFNSKEFPSIRYEASQFIFAQGQLQRIDGVLTMLGQSQPISLQARRFVCGEVRIALIKRQVCGGDFSASLQRSRFGMQRLLPDVGDHVQLDITIEASPAP